MNRRKLLRTLFGAGAATLTVGTALASRKRGSAQATSILLQDTRIAGAAYYEFSDCAAALQVGDTLQLRREVDNRYDRRAVEVLWQNRKLGYLPRRDNAAVASLLDRRQQLRAQVQALLGRRWEPVGIRVWVVGGNDGTHL